MGLLDLFNAMIDATKDDDDSYSYQSEPELIGYWVCPRCGTTNPRYDDPEMYAHCTECKNRRPY